MTIQDSSEIYDLDDHQISGLNARLLKQLEIHTIADLLDFIHDSNINAELCVLLAMTLDEVIEIED